MLESGCIEACGGVEIRVCAFGVHDDVGEVIHHLAGLSEDVGPLDETEVSEQDLNAVDVLSKVRVGESGCTHVVSDHDAAVADDLEFCRASVRPSCRRRKSVPQLCEFAVVVRDVRLCVHAATRQH